MRPIVSVSAGGFDVLAALGERLLSVECIDEAEAKSDRVEITIDSEAGSGGEVIGLPQVGTVLTVGMGYADGAFARRGTYKIDSFAEDGPPDTLVVTGRTADMPSKFRSPRSQSYHQMTLGEIIEDIAGRNAFSPVLDPDLANIVVRHIDQNRESDMSFAARLAAQYDGVAKPVEGRLALVKRGAGSSAIGGLIPPVLLRRTDCETWSYSYSARDEAGAASGPPEGEGKSKDETGGVRAYWTDVRTGIKRMVEVGSAPFSEIRENFHNEAEARAAAGARKNEADRSNCSFSATFGGRVDVQAEAVMVLAGFKSYVPTLWRIKSASHRHDGGGYTTTVQGELFRPDQKRTADEVSKTKPGKDDVVSDKAPKEAVKGGSSGSKSISTDDVLANVRSLKGEE